MVSTTNQIFNVNKYSYLAMNWPLLLSGSAMGTVISELIRFGKEKYRTKKAASQTLIDLNDIYSKCMKPVLDNTPADRFLIMKVENGGGRITPGAQLYYSVIYEDYRRPVESVLTDYQRIMTDKSIVELLMAICTQGSAKVVIKDLEDDSKIKNYYKRDGIVYSELYFIAQTPEKLFYCSIGTANKDEAYFNDSSSRAEIELAVNNLRNIFKKSIKYIK